MTRQQAQKEANARWGDKGALGGVDLAMMVTLYEGPFMCLLVGVQQDAETFVPKGIGQSWESAFADASRREGKP